MQTFTDRERVSPRSERAAADSTTKQAKSRFDTAETATADSWIRHFAELRNVVGKYSNHRPEQPLSAPRISKRKSSVHAFTGSIAVRTLM